MNARRRRWVDRAMAALTALAAAATILPLMLIFGFLLFALGTWQGIYLCEHRDRGGPRSLVVTAWGES